MPTVCATCSVSYKDDERVACDICKIVQHGVCLGLSRTEISVLRNPNRRISFFCQNCNLVETVRSLKDELQSLKNEIDQLKSATKTNGENIEVNGLIGQGAHISNEQLFDEMEDRQQRAYIIIISNLEESRCVTADERKTDDLNKVITLISSNGISNADIVQCVRLGKASNTRKRPLKVTFTSIIHARNVVFKIRTTNGIYINKDLTRYQQNMAYNTRLEFKTRVNSGETNIKLKYFNGIPKIVQLNDGKN
jgi:hypothetical protein